MPARLTRFVFFLFCFAMALSGCQSCESDSQPLVGESTRPGQPLCPEDSCEPNARGCDDNGNVIECMDVGGGCGEWNFEPINECPSDQWCYHGSCYPAEVAELPPPLPDGAESLLDVSIQGHDTPARITVIPYTAFLNALRMDNYFHPSEEDLVQEALDAMVIANDPVIVGATVEYEETDTFHGNVFMVVMDPHIAPSDTGTTIQSQRFFFAVMPGLAGRTTWMGHAPTMHAMAETTLPSTNCCTGGASQPQRSCGFQDPLIGPLTPNPCGPIGDCPNYINESTILESLLSLQPWTQPMRVGGAIVQDDPTFMTTEVLYKGNGMPATMLYVSEGRDAHEARYLDHYGGGAAVWSVDPLMLAFHQPLMCDQCGTVLCLPEPPPSINWGDPGVTNECGVPSGAAEPSECWAMTPAHGDPNCAGACIGCGGELAPGDRCHHVTTTSSIIGGGEGASGGTCVGPGLPSWCSQAGDDPGGECSCDQTCQNARNQFWSTMLGCNGGGSSSTPRRDLYRLRSVRGSQRGRHQDVLRVQRLGRVWSVLHEFHWG